MVLPNRRKAVAVVRGAIVLLLMLFLLHTQAPIYQARPVYKRLLMLVGPPPSPPGVHQLLVRPASRPELGQNDIDWRVERNDSFCVTPNFDVGSASEDANSALRHICRTRPQCCCRPGGKAKPLPDKPPPLPSTSSNNKSSKQGKKCKRLLLIVIMNFPYPDHVSFLRMLYEKAFSKMVFYADVGDDLFGVVRSSITYGFYQHRTIARAMLEHPGFDGYVWIGDDVFMNYHSLLHKLNASQISMAGPDGTRYCTGKNRTGCISYGHWQKYYGYNATVKAMSCLSEYYQQRLLATFGCRSCATKGVSDVGYIPAAYSRQFTYLAQLFSDIFFEYAVPTILRIIVQRGNMQYADVLYLWDPGQRNTPEKYWLPRWEFFHPLKLSVIKNKRLALKWLAEGKSKYAALKSKSVDQFCGLSTRS